MDWKTRLKWLHPGMRVKRWVTLGFLGLLLLMIGLSIIIEASPAGRHPLIERVAEWILAHIHVGLRPGTFGALMSVLGVSLCVLAFRQLVHSLTSALDPDMKAIGLVDVIHRQRVLSQGSQIVVIGGGTGLSTMLRGLKNFSSNITAIVTMTDDGGSSGKLKRDLNILPPGDIRNCLVALSDSEMIMMQLFQYRFINSTLKDLPAVENETKLPKLGYGEGLRDHAFGNLLIAAMNDIHKGDFNKAIQETSRILNIRGQVLPSTVTPVHLRGEMNDGTIMEGETSIVAAHKKIKRVTLVPADACPLEDALAAIEQAEMIVLGPGSVYTSIIPNLLVRSIPEAIRKSKAKKVYVCNVMTQYGESDGFSAYDHVHVIEDHAKMRVFDYVLVNTEQPSASLLEKYKKSGASLVVADIDRIRSSGYRAITGNFINQTDVVRHDSTRLAEAIIKLLN